MRSPRRSRRTRRERVLEVEAGQVVCPMRGIVDLERCWICPAYDGLSSGRVEGVVCRLEATSLLFPPSASSR